MDRHLDQPSSQRNVIEPLESRVLLSAGHGPEHAAAAPHFRRVPALEQPPGVRRIGKTLYVVGTDAADTLRINSAAATDTGKPQMAVVFNGDTQTLRADGLKFAVVNLAGGNDTVIIDPEVTPKFRPKRFIINAGDGDDNVQGGNTAERIFGQGGNDRLSGGGGLDWIDGGDGDDTITGGAGNDLLFGGAGDDVFHNTETAQEQSLGHTRDVIDGGPGNDTADADATDQRKNLEVPVPAD